MFLFRVKVEELDAIKLDMLMADLNRNEESIRAKCPIREMSFVAEGGRKQQGNELDIYLALDDLIEPKQLRDLASEINALLDSDLPKGGTQRVTSELIHI
ncbi:MAG TPA: hypothetical protein VII39_08320 [Bradyrhizobium sp.]|jgi:hypothetical protein